MKVFTPEGLEEARQMNKGDKVLTGEGNFKRVKEKSEIEPQRLFELQMQRFEDATLPACFRVRSHEQGFEYKLVSDLEVGDRMVIPIVKKGMKKVDDKFYSRFYKLDGEFAMDKIEEINEIDVDFLRDIKDNDRDIDYVWEEYSNEHPEKYENCLVIEQEDVSLSEYGADIIKTFHHLKVMSDENFVTKAATIKGKPRG